MLRKYHRLSKKEFSRVFKKGVSFSFEDFHIRYAASPQGSSRFGVSCGLKISKKAVQRNRIRRRLYEIIRANLAQIPKGDYCIIVKPSILSKDFSSLERSLTDSLKNIHERHSRRAH
ncbi:MAG: ribonuclease P protein component [Candidatus Colwellbacteria bacterium]|nr:ribonuclease P protein component [Candidatus Colwellbacteria bacterium]